MSWSVLVLAAAIAQQSSIDEAVVRAVTAHYGKVTDEQQARLRSGLLSLLKRYEGCSGDRMKLALERLDLLVRHGRAFVAAYDYRGAGSKDFPKLPDSYVDREIALSLQYTERYFDRLLRGTPRSPEEVDVARKQVEWLCGRAELELRTAVQGPYAEDAIRGKTAGMRDYLSYIFGQPEGPMFCRPLSREELDAVLEGVRARVRALKEPLRADSPEVGREGDMSDLDEEQFDVAAKLHERVRELVEPLYKVGDLWTPELAAVRQQLDTLKKEVGTWWEDSLHTWNDGQRDKAIRERAAAMNEAALKNRSDVVAPKKAAPEPSPGNHEGRPTHQATDQTSAKSSWFVLLLALLALIACLSLLVARATKRSTPPS